MIDEDLLVARTVTRVIERDSRESELFELPAAVQSYTSIATFKKCPRLARYRYRLRVPDSRSGTLNSTGFDAEDRPADDMDAATFGKTVHRALKFCMQDRIDGHAPDLVVPLEATLEELSPVQLTRSTPPSQEAVERDVAAARTMSEDTLRTGIYWLRCACDAPLCLECAPDVMH